MASLNKVQLIGYVGKNPDLRFTTGGTAVCNISLATTDTYTDKKGEKHEATEWHKVVLFGRLGEIAGDFLKQGSLVYIEGRNKTERWTDKNNQERYSTKVEASHMKLLDRMEKDKATHTSQPHDDIPY
jgi:single-strand DNA-binding protein